MESQKEYLTLSEAAEYLGVSRVTLWRRIRDGALATYQAGASRREKLVRRQDLRELRRPRLIGCARHGATRDRKTTRSSRAGR
jgi:excisionase family DNA binding protein